MSSAAIMKEKFLNGARMLDPEDYLEMTEQLPMDLRDRLTEMREMDLQVQNAMDQLKQIRDVCISLEIDDLKKMSNSLTVLCSEKQKQAKQSKAKKKKTGVVPGVGLKATMQDDLADYGGYDGGYLQVYEDFM
ncbi:Eukaryotic translation initiation factor 3 subunit J [Manis javanica]|nr:Eukaryotic translation initiation factor 3 subunit J [Manis javanica]